MTDEGPSVCFVLTVLFFFFSPSRAVSQNKAASSGKRERAARSLEEKVSTDNTYADEAKEADAVAILEAAAGTTSTMSHTHTQGNNERQIHTKT